MNKKMVILIVAVTIFLGALSVALGYFYAWQKNSGGEVAGESAEEIPVLGWRDYLNSKYGYKIKYPQGWELVGNKDSEKVKIIAPSDSDEDKILKFPRIEILIQENQKALSSRSWILEILPADSYEKRNLRDEEYNKIPATKISNYLNSSFAVFFAHESFIYEFLVYEKENTPEIRAILNTFELTDIITKEYEVYTVKQGETLSYIASKFNIAWPKLAEYNKIKSPDQVYAGQKLKIPLDPSAISVVSEPTAIDVDLARTYQDRVDSGREVWRLDPLEVAKKEVPPQKDISESDFFRIITEDRLASRVTIEITKKNGQKYEAVLIQPVRRGSGGIWMVQLLKINN